MSETNGNGIKATELLRDLRDLVIADRNISELTEKLAAARGVKSGIFKRNEGRGGNKEALKLLLKFRKLENDERAELLDTVAQYAGWAEIPLWSPPSEDRPQGALFAEPDPQILQARQNLEDARVDADASNSFRSGGTEENNPHPVGSRAHQTWATSFADAKAGRPPRMIVVDTGGATVKASTERRPRATTNGNGADQHTAAAEPKKRGRPRKDASAPPAAGAHEEADAEAAE